MGPPWGPWAKQLFFGGPQGPGRRRRGPRVGRGDVRSAALVLLAEQPLHGYQIIQEISERSRGMWRPSPGSVYPMLQQLEDEGLVEAEQAEGRRVFHLTDAGRTYVEERRDELNAVWSSVAGDMTEGVHDLQELAGQVMGAMGQVARAGTETQLAAASRVLADTRRQLYQILAEDEPTDESDEADEPTGSTESTTDDDGTEHL